MTASDAIDIIEQCVDLLDEIHAEDEVHQTFTVNQIREQLWELRKELQNYQFLWRDGPMPNNRRFAPPKE